MFDMLLVVSHKRLEIADKLKHIGQFVVESAPEFLTTR
jgi:hypothetical protein